MILSIEFLKTFLAAIEAGSFTQAATMVYRTQSAVSMQMKRLEEEVGKPLFVRNRKMLVLTDAGELLREHARRIVQSHDDAVTAFKKPALSGKIRFGVEEDYSAGIIAAVESGLAVAPLGLSYLPKHLRALGPESGFPLLPTARIILHKSPAADGDPAIYFERHVAASFRKNRAV